MIRATSLLFHLSLTLTAFAADWPSVLRIEINLSPSATTNLHLSPRQYVPAQVSAFHLVHSSARLHLKGKGTFQTLDEKPNFTISFDSPDAPIAKIHLNNSAQDASYLKKYLGAEIFRSVGVPAPRIAHALVSLNNRPLGLYVLKEGFTDEFLQRSFGSSSGTLFEPAPAGMNRRAGTTAPGGWTVDTNDIDLSAFLDFLALEVMIGHWDGYALGNNNYRVHLDRSGRVQFIPSGMDQLFGNPDLPWIPDMTAPHAREVMRLPGNRTQYERRFRALLPAVFDLPRLDALLSRKLAGLRSHLPAPEFASLQHEADDLRDRIRRREQSLLAQINDPPIRPTFVDDVASLDAWKLRQGSGERGPSGILQLSCAKNVSSWRTTVQLLRGSYRFSGNVQTASVIPLPFGKTHGAALRIIGQEHRSEALTGTTGWTPLSLAFEVAAPEQQVEITCELRAASGAAGFQSLSLIKLGSGIRSAEFNKALESSLNAVE